jgi:hypothetical protein
MKRSRLIVALLTVVSTIRLNKLGNALAICTLAMSLLLLASAASAETVVFGELAGKAIGITELDIGGTLYDVLFPERVPAVLVYGAFPGTFTFTTNGDAQAAVIAVDAALNDANALTVGQDTSLDTTNNLSFNIAYQSIGPTALLGLADFQTGSNPTSDQWVNSGSGSTSWAGEERTWATFTPAAAVPVPAAVWLFGSGLLGLIGIAKRKKA